MIGLKLDTYEEIICDSIYERIYIRIDIIMSLFLSFHLILFLYFYPRAAAIYLDHD